MLLSYWVKCHAWISPMKSFFRSSGVYWWKFTSTSLHYCTVIINQSHYYLMKFSLAFWGNCWCKILFTFSVSDRLWFHHSSLKQSSTLNYWYIQDNHEYFSFPNFVKHFWRLWTFVPYKIIWFLYKTCYTALDLYINFTIWISIWQCDNGQIIR